MKILVLGGTGPIGSLVVDFLSHTENVYVTSRKEHANSDAVVYYLGDAHSIDFMKEIVLKNNRYDSIIDFMKYTTNDFSSRVDMLLGATDHYVFLSSGRVYANKDGLLTENDPRILDICHDQDYLSTDEYALCKARCEDILKKNTMNNWTIVRPYITFNTQRLQLGVYEKENWLKRFLNNHSIVFPEDISEKTTTLTYAYDVALRIAQLSTKDETKKQIYNVTGNYSCKWKEIIEIYNNYLYTFTGSKMKIVYIKDSTDLCSVWNKYQIKYDRLYSRIFDNQKQEAICGCNYKNLNEAIKNCLQECIKKPEYADNKINWAYEGWSDKLVHEFSFPGFIPGKNIIKYLKCRF